MARGTESKEIITKTLLETFKESFLNGKEIRIPMMENGEEIQIKITLTAAKDNVPHGEDQENTGISETVKKNQKLYKEPSPEEINRLKKALKDFGIED